MNDQCHIDMKNAEYMCLVSPRVEQFTLNGQGFIVPGNVPGNVPVDYDQQAIILNNNTDFVKNQSIDSVRMKNESCQIL